MMGSSCTSNSSQSNISSLAQTNTSAFLQSPCCPDGWTPTGSSYACSAPANTNTGGCNTISQFEPGTYSLPVSEFNPAKPDDPNSWIGQCNAKISSGNKLSWSNPIGASQCGANGIPNTTSACTSGGFLVLVSNDNCANNPQSCSSNCLEDSAYCSIANACIGVTFKQMTFGGQGYEAAEDNNDCSCTGGSPGNGCCKYCSDSNWWLSGCPASAGSYCDSGTCTNTIPESDG